MPADEVVDTASLTALQCWMQVERWDRVVDLAALYEERFGSVGHHLPMVLFLKAESLRKSGRPAEAAVVCDHLLELFPEDDLAPRALFLQGILYLEQDDNDGALFHFEKLQRNHPGHELVEDGVFWSAMALAFDKQYAESREAMGRYLEVRRRVGNSEVWSFGHFSHRGLYILPGGIHSGGGLVPGFSGAIRR
ncbi:MAG: tetratricopeptide repeat protein [Verrucomicrobiales bacterium]